MILMPLFLSQCSSWSLLHCRSTNYYDCYRNPWFRWRWCTLYRHYRIHFHAQSRDSSLVSVRFRGPKSEKIHGTSSLLKQSRILFYQILVTFVNYNLAYTELFIQSVCVREREREREIEKEGRGREVRFDKKWIGGNISKWVTYKNLRL